MLCWRLSCSCFSCLLVYSFDCLHGRLLAMRTFLWHPRSCGRFKSPPFRPRIHIAIKIQANAHVAHQRLRKSLLDVALNFIFFLLFVLRKLEQSDVVGQICIPLYIPAATLGEGLRIRHEKNAKGGTVRASCNWISNRNINVGAFLLITFHMRVV